MSREIIIFFYITASKKLAFIKNILHNSIQKDYANFKIFLFAAEPNRRLQEQGKGTSGQGLPLPRWPESGCQQLKKSAPVVEKISRQL